MKRITLVLLILLPGAALAQPQTPGTNGPLYTNSISYPLPGYIERYGYHLYFDWSITNPPGPLLSSHWAPTNYAQPGKYPTPLHCFPSNLVCGAAATNEWATEVEVYANWRYFVMIYWAPNAYVRGFLAQHWADLGTTNWMLGNGNIHGPNGDPLYPMVLQWTKRYPTPLWPTYYADAPSYFFKVRRKDFGLSCPSGADWAATNATNWIVYYP